MFDFEKPRIEIAEISEDKKYGRFVVEPLERGYGTTLGNSLRRIMLSSLPGSAVSQIKIDGVVHEFSGIPGVKEDVTEIVMNIKNLAIKNNSEDMNTPKMMYIDATGEGVVTAADIKCDSDIEIVNSDQVIATLNGGADSKLCSCHVGCCDCVLRYLRLLDRRHSGRGRRNRRHSGLMRRKVPVF